MTKFILLLPLLALVLAGADQTEVAFIPHDKLQAALDNKADIHLLSADNLVVEGNYRNKPGTVEVHESLTDIFYITDGETTFVTGGKYEGGKPIAPGQIRGGTLTGYTTYHLTKGDVIVIPAGIPTGSKKSPKKSNTT